MSSSCAGNERGSGSSSKKGKKGNSDKPKQPLRGLGVAQLEKIRLHGQLSCGYHPSFHTPYPSNSNNADLRVQTGYSSLPFSSFSYQTSSSSSSAPYGLHPNVTMGLAEYDRASIKFGNFQPSNFSRWDPAGNAILENHSFPQQSKITRHLPDLQVEGSSKERRSNSMGSSSQNAESSDSKELDLELRLSL